MSRLRSRISVPGAVAYGLGAVALWSAALAGAGDATADPTPSDGAAVVDPAAPVAPAADAAVAPIGEVPPAAPPAPEVQSFGPLGAVGVDPIKEFTLGQRAPTAPGAVPNTDFLSVSDFLNPTNYRMPTPDTVSPYQLSDGTPSPFARIDTLRGQHAIVHGALGRMPAEQLGQPLPGTAPLPGTNLPAGPEQFLPDPVLPEVTAAPGGPVAPAEPVVPPPS